MPISGFLLIDKPSGWTSFDVVNKVRHIIQDSGLNTTGKKRFPVGHAGTLDPLATGLLIVMVGDYTKQAESFSKLDKTYQVTARLGETSTTGDEEGEKIRISNTEPLNEDILSTLERFKGEIEQVPPAFSAVKVNGKRAYKLAREGKPVEIKPRLVKIYDITDVEYHYPQLSFSVAVSSGTYIRTLVEDIGSLLKTGAYTSQLRRTSISKYMVSDALAVDKLSSEAIYQNLQTKA
ncbi:MAG: tRNA pseudouridine55 synthase [Patescibacteria group bacterium]|nr:tRNA pseudouridine55 synthase [Patescibacteria group bacterium]